MGRRAAIALHLALLLVGLALYVVFILPRWWVLTGDIPATSAAVGRIAAGLPIGAAAVPVWVVLQRSLWPSARTPELALRMLAWSAVLHVAAGTLILLAAIAEVWLSLDAAGPWLFGVYGAAAAMVILAVAAFYLSFIAEKPPAPPKPPKAAKEPRADKKEKRRSRKRREKGAGTVAGDADETPVAAEDDAEPTDEAEPTDDAKATDEAEATDGAEATAVESAEGESTQVEDVEDAAAEDENTEAEQTAVGSALETALETAPETAPDSEPQPSDTAEPNTAEPETAPDAAEHPVTPDTAETPDAPATPTSGLRNKRPMGKIRHRLRR